MLMQELPHDGVAALAEPALSAPATPTPPTRVSVAAASSTLLLMDIGEVSSLGTRSRALRTAAPSSPRNTRRILARPLGTLPAHGARSGQERLTGSVFQSGEGRPGKP